MKRTFLSVAVALSLLFPIALVRPVEVWAAGRCGIEQASADMPIVTVLNDGEGHLYAFGLTSPCADQIKVIAGYNARTKKAFESLDRNVFGRPNAKGEYTCSADPWLGPSDCQRVNQEVNGLTSDDLAISGDVIASSFGGTMSSAVLTEAARQTLNALVQAEVSKLPPPAAGAAPAAGPLVKQGADGPNVEAIQHLLKQHGQDVEVDGDFGSQTKEAIEAFQEEKQIKPASGEVDARTWQALFVTVRQGDDKRDAVRAAQTLLNWHGADIPVDGDFGSVTRAAVEAFQNEKGLTADGKGVVGPQTWAALVNAP
jgi:peptidoglycan hydrolase-like protein with peptidoglycan-binding domain